MSKIVKKIESGVKIPIYESILNHWAYVCMRKSCDSSASEVLPL